MGTEQTRRGQVLAEVGVCVLGPTIYVCVLIPPVTRGSEYASDWAIKKKTLPFIGTLDTKGTEIGYVKDCAAHRYSWRATSFAGHNQ